MTIKDIAEVFNDYWPFAELFNRSDLSSNKATGVDKIKLLIASPIADSLTHIFNRCYSILIP